MRRLHTLFFASRFFPAFLPAALATALVALGTGLPVAQAQADDEPEMTFDENEAAEPEPEAAEPEPEPDVEPEPEPEVDPDGDSNAGIRVGKNVEKVSWQDIVVVVRKPFLKLNRIELVPSWGVTMNDTIIRHFQFAAALNYYLTDVLAVGIEGQYYIKSLREPFDLIARQARLLPTVNKYNFGAALNFHYIPIYGKFALLDTHIIHWETALTIGLGFTQSEVLPRDPALQPFKNTLITPNVGIGMRFFLNRFLTVNVGIRDYAFVDKFENASRMEPRGDIAKESASPASIHNVIFQAGISVWFPMSFKYTTFR